MPNIGTGEIVLLLLLALLLFGAKRLPEIGRSLGSGMRGFKDSVPGKTPRPRTELPAATPAPGVLGSLAVSPAAAHFLTNYDKSVYAIQIQARPFLTFAAQVLFAMALVFELPIFVVGLTRTGILTTSRLRRNRRIGYFIVV